MEENNSFLQQLKLRKSNLLQLTLALQRMMLMQKSLIK
nr:MAG TPA: hypothetical protein [Caudoviricetes sp.]